MTATPFFASRRSILALAVTCALPVTFQTALANSARKMEMLPLSDDSGTLPKGVRSRIIRGVNGLDVHILEGGYESVGRPLALLLHGFPDLAYGWRHLIPLLAEAGYHVVAPDQRGYGRTTGWERNYDAALEPFGILNMTRDAIALVSALGYRRTAMLVGHDTGSPIAAYCSIARPDIFPSVVLMSAPFPGVPPFPFNTAESGASPSSVNFSNRQLADELAALDPPRQFYQDYLSTRQANDDMSNPPQGLESFMRAFFHVKSADWPGNQPHPLKAKTASELAQLPTYYVMDLGKSMPETVAPFLPSEDQIRACKWLTQSELAIYVSEYDRTGFQGALQAYRIYSDAKQTSELRLFSGRKIDVPALFIGGKSDWGTYSSPGALEAMKDKATTKLYGIEFIDGAGHWIQQEQLTRLADMLLAFAGELRRTSPGLPLN